MGDWLRYGGYSFSKRARIQTTGLAQADNGDTSRLYTWNIGQDSHATRIAGHVPGFD
jgi:hypothetical protein